MFVQEDSAPDNSPFYVVYGVWRPGHCSLYAVVEGKREREREREREKRERVCMCVCVFPSVAAVLFGYKAQYPVKVLLYSLRERKLYLVI